MAGEQGARGEQRVGLGRSWGERDYKDFGFNLE